MNYVWVMLDRSNLLGKSSEPHPFVRLFKRLEQIYWDWSDGRFIDEVASNLPQKKMQLMNAQLQAIKSTSVLGLRQVDVFTGLNLLILLFSMHRYAKSRDDCKDAIDFHPCGQPGTDKFDPQRLLRTIGYSDCVAINTFNATVRRFLGGADLRGANLSGANLFGANLGGAGLSGADLSGVAQTSVTQTSVAQTSVAQTSVAQTSVAQTSFAQTSVAQTSVAQTSVAQTSVAQTSVAQTSVAQTSLAQTSLAQTSVAQTSVAQTLMKCIDGKMRSGKTYKTGRQ